MDLDNEIIITLSHPLLSDLRLENLNVEHVNMLIDQVSGYTINLDRPSLPILSLWIIVTDQIRYSRYIIHQSHHSQKTHQATLIV